MQTDNQQKASRVQRRDVSDFVAPRREWAGVQVAAREKIRATVSAETAQERSLATHHPVATKTRTPSPTLEQKPVVQPQEPLSQFDLPQYIPHERPTRIVPKKKRWFKVAGQGLAFALVLGVFTGGFLFWRGYANFHKIFRGDSVVAALSDKKVAPEHLKGEGDGRVNILMLGIGGQGHAGGDLTDTIMVLSVDPVNYTASMLSVPRDMWVKMPVNYFGAYQKINAAYSSGKYKTLGRVDLSSTSQQAIDAGFTSVDEAVSQVLGVRISYHMLVDFKAFEKAVDTVQGVTVKVDEQLYDPTMAWANYNNPVLAPVGVQSMDGRKALMYARSRETTSDFSRSERQRQLLVALKQKVLTMGTLSNPAKINGLMTAFGNNIHTDISPDAATRLFSIMKKVDDANIRSLSLTTPTSLVTTDRVGNASVVRPRAGFDNYSDIQAYVRSQLQDGYILKEHAPVAVIGANETLRANTVLTLKDYGYNLVNSTVAASLPSGITIVDLSKGQAPYTLHYLQDRYGLAAVTTVPAGVQVSSDTQFAIITGT